MSAEILCFGEPMLEFNQLPVGEDGRRLYLEGFGGDSSNAAIAAARSGAKAAMLTALGNDRAGQAFRTLWRDEGVDDSAVSTDPEAATGIYFVTHDARGHDFTFHRKGSAAARLGPTALPQAAIRAARVLHLSGITLGISDTSCDAGFAAMRIAREAGALVSFDTNLRLRLWPLDRARACIHAAVANSDIVFPSLDDARLLTGLEEVEKIAEFYLRGKGGKFWKAEQIASGKNFLASECTQAEFEKFVRDRITLLGKTQQEKLKQLSDREGYYIAAASKAPMLETYSSIKWSDDTTIITGRVQQTEAP
jgi:2-dehydro-3-deoxygluconokinase